MPAGISAEVKNAITSSMQPRKKDRPQNVRSFLDLLPDEKQPQTDEEDTVVVTPEKPLPPAPPVSPANKYWKIASISLLCASLALGVLFFTQKKESGPDMSGEVKTLTLEKEDLQKQLTESQSKEKTLTQSNTNLRKQVDDLKSQVSTQTSKINSLQSENASLKKQVNEYKPKADRWDRSMNSK